MNNLPYVVMLNLFVQMILNIFISSFTILEHTVNKLPGILYLFLQYALRFLSVAIGIGYQLSLVSMQTLKDANHNSFIFQEW